MAVTIDDWFRFGSARWAQRGQVAQVGLHGPSGPFLGFLGDDPLRLPGDAPLITFGGAGSGKLRDVLAYSLCGMKDRRGAWHAPRRMLINDPRGELAAISIGNQIRLGKTAYCFNPFGLHGLPRHRINPWNILRADSPTFHVDVKVLIADLIALPAHGETYFGMRARDLSEMLTRTWVAGTPTSRSRDAISLAGFYELVNMMAVPSGWDALMQRMRAMPDGDIRRVAEEMDDKRRNAPKEYGAIVGSLYEAIQPLSAPAVREALNGSDFSLEALCKEDCNMYLVIPAEYLGLLAPVQRAIFGSAMLYKNRHPAAPQVLLVVDEAAQLGNFEALLRAYSYGRGMGLRTWSFWQAPAQLERNHGRGALSTFINSSQCRQFFGVRDLETATLVSKMLGQQTITFDSGVEQEQAKRNYARTLDELLRGGDPIAAGLDFGQYEYTATNQYQQARALLMPDEVLNLPEDEQILFISGLNLRAVRARKQAYFTTPAMAGGYLPNPFHPPHDRVAIETRRGQAWARVIRESVPAHLTHWPQHQTGEWSYVEGYRPA